MNVKIALVGNPNAGKTTLFNALTGSNQQVGNWPGVTVERKEGKLSGSPHITVQDLPGIYSLSPYTPEEVITRNYLVEESPNLIINIIDGTNMERNLYLTTQLLELGIPMILGINMIDVVEKNGDIIHLKKLAATFGCEAVGISALKGSGIQELKKKAIELTKENKPFTAQQVFGAEVTKSIDIIKELIHHNVKDHTLPWFGTKVFERDEKVLEALHLSPEILKKAEIEIQRCEDLFDDDTESIISNERYTFIHKTTEQWMTKNPHAKAPIADKIDNIVTNRWLALPIFVSVMFLVYYISVTTFGAFLTDWTNDTFFGAWVIPGMSAWLTGLDVAPWLVNLIVDGIIGGVGAVLGFVPQLLVLFLMLSALEDCGYMARVAFIMDRIFRKFGLSGKSFIPMLIGSGCSVPGIMASRTIEADRDRRITIMTTSFIPCGAKIPIIALIAGALFGGGWWVAPLAYFIGITAVLLSGVLLKKTKLFAGEPAPFVMELPAYHLPTAKNILRTTGQRGMSFIKRAGTIILLCSVALWFLQIFGFVNGTFAMVTDNNTSLLASLGKVIAPVFAPLGFGQWQSAVATFTGLIAKENVVNTFGVLYGFAEVAESGMEYWTMMAKDFSPLSGFSFLLFNLLCAPCFAAIGAIKQEMGNKKWTGIAILYLTVFAYVISFIIYQLGLVFTGQGFTLATAFAIVLLGGFLYLVLRKNKFETNERNHNL